MSYQLFFQRFQEKIKKARDDQVDAMALGYARDDYDSRVGLIRGYDEAIIFAKQLLRDLTGEEE